MEISWPLVQLDCKYPVVPRWYSVSACQFRRHGFDPQIWKICWRRKWQLIPTVLTKKSQGQRSLAGYSPWGGRESDMTEHTQTHSMISNSGCPLKALSFCVCFTLIFVSPPPFFLVDLQYCVSFNIQRVFFSDYIPLQVIIRYWV